MIRMIRTTAGEFPSHGERSAPAQMGEGWRPRLQLRHSLGRLPSRIRVGALRVPYGGNYTSQLGWQNVIQQSDLADHLPDTIWPLPKGVSIVKHSVDVMRPHGVRHSFIEHLDLHFCQPPVVVCVCVCVCVCFE